MPMQMMRECAETPDHPDRLREVIPHHLRTGFLRRHELPDGGIEFVEARTDRVYATFDRRGRLVSRGG
jgi:hypothetical protein